MSIKNQEELTLKTEDKKDEEKTQEIAKLSKFTEEQLKIHEEIRRIESMDFYYKKFLLIVAVTAGSILIAFIRGGKDLKSIIGSTECSTADWIAFGVYAFFMLVCITLCFLVVHKEQRLKKASKFPHHPDEHLFKRKFLWSVNIIGLAIGFVSTNIGIGGGAILTPVLLKLHF